ncbi:MAG: S-methyl-5-thioribose-1-phosphate isomerase [Spirochaetaceae bacterium]|jgi:methylthioribose-1-phosphate isomerase|nr:S-methyl-5-thioribose-1-phosphate isomerase [Spirochaetaceae bacterium]
MIKTMRWDEGRLFFLDQTKLPLEVIEEEQLTVKQVWNSIKKLKVRGAPAIGIAAAYGLVVAMKDYKDSKTDLFIEEMNRNAAYLETSRPTAVNLSWALKRMCRVGQGASLSGFEAKYIYHVLEREAILIHEEDKKLCRGIGEEGLTLIKPGMGILTHCNAGALATSELGTATAPMYLAHEQGIPFQVFADETRPLLQGARLTSWELQQAGIDVTLICDDMAASIMAEGLIDLVIVGTDRVSANGDVANKIGTLGVAILASYYKIPFYVACPSSTIDLYTKTGAQIIIEERGAEEIIHFGERRTGPENIKVRNPAFDVTPFNLVTGIITDKGIIEAPYEKKLRELF